MKILFMEGQGPKYGLADVGRFPMDLDQYSRALERRARLEDDASSCTSIKIPFVKDQGLQNCLPNFARPRTDLDEYATKLERGIGMEDDDEFVYFEEGTVPTKSEDTQPGRQWASAGRGRNEDRRNFAQPYADLPQRRVQAE
jgi:hypothetical protein